MAVTFNQISTTNRVPGPQVEVDGSRANASRVAEPHRALIIGIRLSTGTATEGQIKDIRGALDGDAFFGSKSQLAAMTRAYKRVNRKARVQAMALDEDSGGTAAVGTLPITGTATESKTAVLRIGDQRISIAVTSGDSATVFATALDVAINALERLMFTSTRSTASLAITCRHKGLIGNSVTMEFEYLPAGLACTVAQIGATTPGAGDPDLADAIAALADERYDTIVVGLVADANMDLIETAMSNMWGPTAKKPGMIIAGTNGSFGTLSTYGSARNSQYSCVMGSGLSPTPPWIWASQTAARDAQRCDTQPNRPRNGMTLPDCEAPKVTDRFDHDDRNLLLFDGISTFKVSAAGDVMIERLITTYQTNANSLADATYLSMETQRNLADLYLRQLALAGKYADYMLAPDGTEVDPGVPVLTPAGWRGELIAWYDQMVRAGRVKDAAGFAEDLVVEINADDTERLDTESAPRLIGGLVTMAHKIAFQL
jgi:phage tail sheath gpL-like